MSFAELLTAQEVADACRVSVATVRRWASEGELERVNLPGRVVRFRRAQVERLLESTEAAS